MILNNDKLKDKLNEVEIKYIFVLLLLFIFLANLGGGQAILPSFILGIFDEPPIKITSSIESVPVLVSSNASFTTLIHFLNLV